MLADLADKKEEQNCVMVSGFDRRTIAVIISEEEEAADGGEEVASDEEGFVWEREEVEVAEGDGEECWGGEYGGEATVAVEGLGEDGVSEV